MIIYLSSYLYVFMQKLLQIIPYIVSPTHLDDLANHLRSKAKTYSKTDLIIIYKELVKERVMMFNRSY
ncbi:hypothetical protein CsatB_023832 [Cannabis sativa]